MKRTLLSLLWLAPHLANATPAVVNADTWYNFDQSTAEQQSIQAACGANAVTCFPDVSADVQMTNGGFQNWTQGDVDPLNATKYWHGTDPDWGNVAFFNSNTNGPANGLLLLMLPGCGDHPEGYTHFYLRAAALGYHVISVPYWNECGNTWTDTSSAAATSQCQQVNPNDNGYTGQYTFGFWPGWSTTHYMNFTDSQGGDDDTTAPNADACQTRLERFKVSRNGNDYDTLASGYHFNPPNTYGGDNVHHRVLTWLQFLDGKYPSQGWNQFYSGSTVNWSKITVAGHSQGSGLVPQVLDTYPAYRGIMVSGPQSQVYGPSSGGYTAPSYIKRAIPYAANIWSYYGYQDTGNGPRVVVLDSVLGLANGSVSYPYEQDSNGFILTDVCQGNPCVPPNLAALQATGGHKLAATNGSHNSIIHDVDGDPRPWSNRPAWDYLLTGKGGAGASCITNAWCTSGTCNPTTGTCQ